MAHIQSIGLHEPCALQYLVNESLLPDLPSSSAIKWQVHPIYDEWAEEVTDEEVLHTKNCVVWSRGGVVKRAFNLEVEDEEILHSFVTRFRKVADDVQPKQSGLSCDEGVGHLSPDQKFPDRPGLSDRGQGQALVVVLKSKAHVYFLTGDMHTVSLPFEVEAAFPTPQGCLFQRKAAPSTLNATIPVAPPNSFVSSQPKSSSQESQKVMLKAASKSGPSLVLSPVARQLAVVAPRSKSHVPSILSLTDTQKELGLSGTQSLSQTATRVSDEPTEGSFDPAEELIYVSRDNELPSFNVSHIEPLLLAVTWNAKSNTFTVWKVQYRPRDTYDSPAKKRKSGGEGKPSRRRSSNMLRASGSATPIGRSLGGSRESLGLQTGQSFPEAHPVHEHNEHKHSEVESLASELAPEFADLGVQTRATRRVSSMIARTDLSMGPDRGPMTGFASGNSGRRNSHRTAPRGESFGISTERQSLGARPRNSIPGAASFVNNESLIFNSPIERLLEGINSGNDAEAFKAPVSDGAMNELPLEVIFSRLTVVPCSDTIANMEWSKKDFKVFSLPTAHESKTGNAATGHVSICIIETKKSQLSVIKLRSTPTPLKHNRKTRATTQGKAHQVNLEVTAVNVQRGTNIVDACKLRDGDHSAMLALTKSRTGQMTLVLEALGISSITIDLPETFLIRDPLDASPAQVPGRVREAGRGRVVKAEIHNFTALENTSTRGQVDLLDAKGHRHRVQVQLQPRHPLVKKILKTLELVLQDRGGYGVYIAWIEAMNWLRSRGRKQELEWPAMAITLFSMIIPFVSNKAKKSRLSTRRSKADSGAGGVGALEMSSWDEMLDEEYGKGRVSSSWPTCPGWQWIGRKTEVSKSSAQQQRLKPNTSGGTPSALEGKRNSTIHDYVSWAREFMQIPVGQRLIGADGILPTAPSKDQETRRTAVGCVLIGLHLLREEHKLDIRSSRSFDSQLQLSLVLAQIGCWLKWPAWGVKDGCYYSAEIKETEQQILDENTVLSLDSMSQPFGPPSIFEFVEESLANANVQPFPTLLDIATSQESAGQHVMKSRAALLTPRTFALLKFFTRFASLQNWQARVELMCKCGLNAEMLATLPTGISAAFYEAISHCEGIQPPSWSGRLLRLIGREDVRAQSKFSSSLYKTGKSHSLSSHNATRDYHGIGSLVLDTEPSHAWDASSEVDRQSVTRLIFRDDRRFQDASRLVNQLKPPVVECQPEPDWTEADLLDAQKELVQLVAMRTLTVASGRGMMNYSSRVPLLTEKVTIPAFTLQCQLRPSNVTSSADRGALTEDRAVWAFFHNGTAAGLTISRDARGLDTSWILYNKPPELTNRHAGFLLALGLNGHLKSLAKWVAFKYLTPKHAMTSIGLLLGLSASHIGTMDTLITRLLSVHVTRMLPAGAAELNLSPLTQTTGIMGIGLLYCGSQHRRMSEVMLSEIENNDVEEGVPAEQTLRDEGYRLAAGFALGFMNLGQGKHLHGLRDMDLESRLLSVATSTKNVNLVHILDRATSGATVAFALIYLKTNDASIASKIDIPETIHQFGYVRPDIFLLRTVARHLIMWDSIVPTSDFIRGSLPKAYRHRASLSDTRSLVSEDMPFFNILAGICLALGLRFAGSGSRPVRDLLTSYLDHFIRLTRLPALNYDARLTRNAVRNCQDATALALSAVMAGTGDLVVFRRLRSLHGRIDPDTPYGSHLAAHMAIGILFLGGGTYTLGTNDRAVASLLCAFYPIFPTSVTDNHAHLQAFRHLWVLAAEARCVVPRDVETGKPIAATIVVVMKDSGVKTAAATTAATTTTNLPKEERGRRLTAPCLIPDLDEIEEVRTEARGYWNVRISFLDDEGKKRREDFKSGHQLNIPLSRRAAYDAAKGSVFVSELRALAEQGPAPSMVGFSSSSLSPSSVPHPPPLPPPAGGAGGLGTSSGGDMNPFEWIWHLPALRDLVDVSERALVLPAPHAQAGGKEALAAPAGMGSNTYLGGTVVDTRLELEFGVLDDDVAHDGQSNGQRQKETKTKKKKKKVKRDGDQNEIAMHRDALWQLRLLFAWAEASDRREEKIRMEKMQKQEGESGGDFASQEGDDAGGTWLRRDVIERLRWRVWRMRMGVDGEGDDDDGQEEEQEGGEGEDDQRESEG